MILNPILRFTAAFTAVAITAMGLCIGLRMDAKVAAKQTQDTAGSLMVVGPNGKLKAQCPLKHTNVKAEISGFLSRVVVTQNFENPFKEKIEAVYVFPLPKTRRSTT